MNRTSSAALALGLLATDASACRQALVLGLDVSGSVDAAEYRLQIDGLAGALQSDPVREVLLATPESPVRIAVFEWSGPDSQRILLPFATITDEAALEGAAARIVATERVAVSPTTAIGSALQTGFDLLATQPDCLARTLDISGDGQSNTGPRPQTVAAPDWPRPAIVNALVVATPDPNGDARHGEIKELSSYFSAYVIRGPGAFVETALGFEDYQAAMTRKLLRELTSLILSDARSH